MIIYTYVYLSVLEFRLLMLDSAQCDTAAFEWYSGDTPIQATLAWASGICDNMQFI